MLCLISQRYELKANHNALPTPQKGAAVVFNKSKIQVESKSQQNG